MECATEPPEVLDSRAANVGIVFVRQDDRMPRSRSPIAPVIAVWPGSTAGKAAHNFVGGVARSERASSLVSTPFEPF
jgi:hypothetical protein